MKQVKKTGKWLYMHTINGIPAMYYDGRQICYMNSVRGQSGITKLAESVKQIKHEQAASNKWRKSKGWDIISDYGYVRILRQLWSKE